jgi:uncharacterized protein YcgL (UPF0745 family)
MSGYTDGVQKTISEKSMNKGLDYTAIGKVDPNNGDSIVDALNNYFTTELDGEDMAQVVKSLQDDGYYSLESPEDVQELELDGDELGYREDWYEVVNSLSEGGIYLICDTDKEVLGARMGAAGEHIGSVSVWVDTFNKTVTGWGETLPLSDNDCEEINDTLNEMY